MMTAVANLGRIYTPLPVETDGRRWAWGVAIGMTNGKTVKIGSPFIYKSYQAALGDQSRTIRRMRDKDAGIGYQEQLRF